MIARDIEPLFVRADIAEHWRGRDAFAAARAQQGDIYRDKEGRRTLRFENNGRGYFLKLHQGVGWKEIFKNLAQGRAPVLGASNEYRAIRALEAIPLDTLSAAAFGCRGDNPATQLSFLVTDELTDVVTLEDFCAGWPQQPPTFALKKKLIERVATIAHKLHAAGINHRDFYLCHFLLQNNGAPIAAENLDARKLYLIDLHRAQIRARVPLRWLIKDLGGLYYSALNIGLNQRDVFRFMRAYTQKSLRELFTADKSFWLAVRERARRIYVRDHRREPTSAAWQRRPEFVEAFLQGLRDLPKMSTIALLVDGRPALLDIESILRLLPGKRVVVKGKIDGRDVIAKLFVRSASSARHIERERNGCARTTAAGVLCPQLLDQCATLDKRCEGLIYEFIADAAELSQRWDSFTRDEKCHCLRQIVDRMLALHRAGVYQSDIHADNFLLRGDTIFLLDMGSIECSSAPLSRDLSLRNLGALIAQFTLAERELFAAIDAAYFAQRSWSDSEKLHDELHAAIDTAWQARKRDYLDKALRVCTLTGFQRAFSQLRAYRRIEWSDDLARFFREPDAAMATATLLKAGNTATVAKALLAGKPVVIKRYNIKNWRHAFSRAVRRTRAEHAWRYAHLLELAGIRSLQPIALFERRCGPLRSTAYFIGSWIDAPDLLTISRERALRDEELTRLATLFEQMRQCRLSHGDFKANNLLLCNDAIALIDLDAMREHRSERSWRKAFARDIKRLLRNWAADHPVYRQITALIEAIALREGAR